MQFHEGSIDGVECRKLTKHDDHRGWLTEVFRQDELKGFEPAMCYVSLTLPGVTRGPHEHREQSDWFVFTGPGTFEIRLWDNREKSVTYGYRQTFVAGDDCPMCVIVPSGVVHGYKNISGVDGLVVNCPDRLFAGWNRNEPVDEIRHGDNTNSPFMFE